MFTAMPTDDARHVAGSDPAEALRSVRERLGGSRFSDVRWVAETGSTNTDVLGLARDGAGEGVVVVADRQRSGRGRRGRAWVAPAGSSLLVSVLLRPPATLAPVTTMAAGVAMVDAVEQVAEVTARLKWPNDLVVPTPVGDRKLAGMLTEADWPAGSNIAAGWRQPADYERAVVVVGVGVNVCWPSPGEIVGDEGGDHDRDEVPPELLETATALNWLTERVVERADLLVAFLIQLEQRYGEMVASGSEPIVDAWRERSATLGQAVRVDLGADDLEGTAVDVTRDGRLIVETLEGIRRTLAVGDIVHLRAR